MGRKKKEEHKENAQEHEMTQKQEESVQDNTPAHITAEEFQLKCLEFTALPDCRKTENFNSEMSELLGFSEGQKWTPHSRYIMRRDDNTENSITVYKCPIGLYSVSALLTSDRKNDDMERETVKIQNWCGSAPAAKNIIDTAIFDTDEEALKYIFHTASAELHSHVGFGTETIDWLTDVYLGDIEPSPIEEDEDSDSAAYYSEGQQMSLDPEIFPTLKDWISPGQKKTAELLNAVNAKLFSEQEDLKEIKAGALAPYKARIDSKKSVIEMYERLSIHFEITKCIEEARAKSAFEDLVFSVYTIPCGKGPWIKVGTGQDVLEDRLQFGDAYVFIVAEFDNGELVGSEVAGDDEAINAEDCAELEEEDRYTDAESKALLWKCPNEPAECCMAGDDINEAKTAWKCDECPDSQTGCVPEIYEFPETTEKEEGAA